MKNLLMRLWREEEGQDLVEYALLIALVATAAIAAMNTLAGDISTVFSKVGGNLTAATT